MEYPKVIILIPIRNVAKYIKECLDHLMAQTYPADKFEVWLLDNHSDDGSLEIIDQYPKDRVKVIQSGVHSPPLKYNKILPEIEAPLIGLVDGDANVDKVWLESTVKAVMSDDKLAGASGPILTANTDKVVARIIGYELQNRYENLPKEITRVATMHVVYRAEVIKKIGAFSEKLKTGYDCEIGHRLRAAGYKIAYVPEAKVWHNHRDKLWGYFKQQYEYGEFAIVRYMQMPKIAKGDEVTSFWMISQPLFYLASLILLIFWFFYHFAWPIILIPLIILLLTYILDSLKLAIKYKDASALIAIVIYILRPIAWGLGAFSTLINPKKIKRMKK